DCLPSVRGDARSRGSGPSFFASPVPPCYQRGGDPRSTTRMPLTALYLVPAILVGATADLPPPTEPELEALAQRMAGPDAADRVAGARKLATAPATGFDLYVKRLQRARTTGPVVWRTLILEAWAQVPNPDYAKDGNLWLRKPEPKPPKVKKGEP